MPKKQKWETFLFDGKGWFDVVDSPEKFLYLLSVHDGNLEELLAAKRLRPEDEANLIGNLPRFSSRQDRIVGMQTLGEWFEENKIKLAFAKSKKK
jgi:hypothetical protein